MLCNHLGAQTMIVIISLIPNENPLYFTHSSECTFLILDKNKFLVTGNEIESLIGDTNLFILPNYDDGEGTNRRTAETEIMIAESTARGHGHGWESMLLMIEYGIRFLNCKRFLAKIGCVNAKSIEMFKKMQFIETSRSEVFQEITFERLCDEVWLTWLRSNIEYTIESYNS